MQRKSDKENSMVDLICSLTKDNNNNKFPKGLDELIFEREIKKKEFLKGIGSNRIKDIIKFKIKERKIKSTEELSYLIYDIIDILVSPIDNDKDYFIRYINRKIIVHINQSSKGIKRDENGSYINLQKKGKLEKHKRYGIIKNIVLPIMEVDTSKRTICYLDQQKKFEREFKSFIINRGDSSENELTISPKILIYLYLCNKRKNKKYNELYKEILKENYGNYEFRDLINFYNELNDFIRNDVEYSEYLTVGYEILENKYRGYRIGLIIKEFEEKPIKIKNEVTMYKLELYLGILLLLRDIELSEYKIRKVIEYYINGEDNKIESVVYDAIRYSSRVYGKIDYLINEAVSQMSNINIQKINYYDVNKYEKLFESFVDKNLKNKKYEYIFSALNISMEFLCNQAISYKKIRQINKNITSENIFTPNSGILYLLLGGYLEYRENNE